MFILSVSYLRLQMYYIITTIPNIFAKSYQKVLVLTFIYINKVVFYRFSQYVSNILVLSRYYFILGFYYKLYIIHYYI